MAGRAGRSLVFVGEGEGSLVVIEVRLVPGGCVMTRGALGPQRTTVHVIFPMAVVAG